MDAYGFRGNVSVHLNNDISGGGKRGRHEATDQMVFVPTPSANDIPIAQKVLGITKVDFQALISSMPLQQLEKLETTISETIKTSKAPFFMKPYMEFVPEFVELQELNKL